MSVIATNALTKRYGELAALDSLTVSVPGGVVGLVGANGAGKSTLIKILLGLLPATSGSATLFGLDVATQSLELRSQIGYMPEHDCLPPDVTATELVVHLARMSGLPATAARERAADTLRHVGLYEERYRLVGGYSTGMKQRVKLAQALVHDPKLIMLDEPTNGLDPAGRDEMLDLIARIGHEFGVNVLVTSHLLGELERISDHVVVIQSGQLVRSTSTASATGSSDVLTVELTDRLDDFVALLVGAGFEVGRTPKPLTVDVRLGDGQAGDPTYDAVRDAAANLQVGLIRVQRQRHHLSEIFVRGGATMTEPSGAIHDIGYRHYTGERLPSRYAARALTVEGLRGAFGFGRSAKAKVMPLILLGLVTFAALLLGASAAIGNLDELEVRPAPFVPFVLLVVSIFVASQAPQLVSRDLRFRTVSLYFSRPLRREEYLGAKVAAMTGAVVVFLAIPVTVLTAGALLANVPTMHALADWVRGIGAAVIAAIVFSAIALLVAAITPRRGLGVAAIIAVFMVSTGFAGSLTALGIEQDQPGLEDYAGLLSPVTIVEQVVMFVTRVPLDAETQVPDATKGFVYLAAALLLVAVCYLLLVLRYRKVSVT